MTLYAPAQDMVLVHEGMADGGLVITWYVNAALYTRDTAQTWFDTAMRMTRQLFFLDGMTCFMIGDNLLFARVDDLVLFFESCHAAYRTMSVRYPLCTMRH